MTNTTRIENESRRRFLHGVAGLTLAVYLPGVATAASAGAVTGSATSAQAFEPNAFLRVGADNTVTVISKHLEMGQGTYTGLATIVAEEMNAAWSQVRVEGAPADAKRFNNLLWGAAQGTGGSTAIANSWEQLRRAGASARAMLIAAAAQQWQVPVGELSASEGVVAHSRTGRQASFGELAHAAARQPVPTEVKLKDPKDFKLIGKRAPRKDSADKVNGKARFTQDVHLPGMLTAVVAHPPRFGAKVKSFDAAKVKTVKGVVEVVEIPTGVAVLAKDTWSAKKGRDALQVEWDESAAFKLGTDEIFARYHELAKSPGLVARKEGDPEAAFATSARVLRATYDFPYLAHAAMEPMNCVVRLSKDGCEIWNGEQAQTVDQTKVAALLGLEPEQVTVHMLYAGGSFGRRANKDADYVLEAVSIAKAIDGRLPESPAVKLVWLREDDMGLRSTTPSKPLSTRRGGRPPGATALSGSRSSPVRHSQRESRMASTRCRSRAPPTCLTPFPACSSICTRRRTSECRFCGGARLALRTPPIRPKPSSTSSPPQRARIRSLTVWRYSDSIRVMPAC